MHLYQKPLLSAFTEKHPDSRLPIDCWQLEAEEARWAGPKDVKTRYKTADLSPNRIIFDLGRGRYRLQVAVRYERGILLVEDVWVAKARLLALH
jgi:mRNA interferase HigB